MSLPFGQLLRLEWKKEKRTGAFMSLVMAGCFGALYALVNFTWRKTSLLALDMEPMDILLTQSYGMMALFNAFGIVVSSCLVYHIEFQEHGLEKLLALSLNMARVYLAKFFWLALALCFAIGLESVSLLGIGLFVLPPHTFELSTWFSFSLYMLELALPTLSLMMWIASLFETIWIPLGIGVAGFFSAMALAQGSNFWLINPFLLLLKPALLLQGKVSWTLSLLALIETLLFLSLGLYTSQRRRSL